MWNIRVFYDAECPLCSREVNWLRRRTGDEKVSYLAIQDPDFESASGGIPREVAMERMHGILPDGTVVTGVEVFRRLYAEAGFGAVVPLTRLPIVRQLLDIGYTVFAKNRLKLTGRCTPTSCS